MHEYCLNEYALAQNVQKSALRCPVCRHAGATDPVPQIEEIVEDTQQSEELNLIDLIEPAVAARLEVAEPEVAEPAVAAEPEVASPVVAKGKGGGKQRQGRAKPKAEPPICNLKPRLICMHRRPPWRWARWPFRRRTVLVRGACPCRATRRFSR